MKVLIVAEEGALHDHDQDVLRELQRMTPGASVILTRDLASLENAVQSLGSIPLEATTEIAASRHPTPPPASHARGNSHLREPFAPVLVGESSAVRELRTLVNRVATSPVTTVLLSGESGSGKSLVARAIHAASPGSTRPFVVVACSALPESVLEADLAKLTDGGTLFLDEISEMSAALQRRLLRFMDEGIPSRSPGGGPPDAVRVIAATHDDMEELLADGRFRRDLYYRLRGVPIHILPLRERREDIEPLAEHFVSELSPTFDKSVTSISTEARKQLTAHSWPGNVRELRQCIERALLVADGSVLGRVDTGSPERRPGEHLLRLPREGLVLADLEKSLVLQALEATRWNQVRAARLLGLNRDQVRYRIEKFGLSAPPAADDGCAA